MLIELYDLIETIEIMQKKEYILIFTYVSVIVQRRWLPEMFVLNCWTLRIIPRK